MYIYPENLKAKPMLWLWLLRDIAIIGVAALISVLSLVQGIGMALTENITYNKLGKLAENSLMQYKIPTRVDIGKIRVDFESSYENEGPFGAKSIGEVVINTPLPAVADAIYNATGTRFYELPITPEKIAMAVLESK